MPELLEIDPDAIQTINWPLLKNPPGGTEAQDQEALAQIYGIARDITRRLITADLNQSQGEMRR